MTREMLKEAIADAKTIKETAIASAKSALEEAFTPQLTAMFAERLNELELEEEDTTEDDTMNEMYREGEGEDKNLEEDFSLEELLAELSREDDEEETKKEGMDKKSLEEDLMLEDMSDEEIEELVMQVIDDMIKSGKLMPGEGEEDEEGEDMEDMEEPEMGDESDMEGEEEEIDEDINLEELLAEMEDDKEKVKENLQQYLTGLEGVVAGGLPLLIAVGAYLVGAYKENKAKEILKKAQDGDEKAKKELNTIANTIKDQFPNNKMEESKDKAEEKETEETIKELRKELNEVNLLNAKLLYTNKIFKTKNLTESEKIKVLNTFDKAETVKEVKLVFETLNESFKTTTVKKNTIKESLGSASKTISTATPKQPIIEVNNAFARMQQLAGLRK
jgi:hypothetical protein